MFSLTPTLSSPTSAVPAVFDLQPWPPPLMLVVHPAGGGAASVGVVHDGLHVVPGKEAGGAVHHALIPAVVVLLDDVDDGTLLEGQLILLVPRVVVDGHHCRHTPAAPLPPTLLTTPQSWEEAPTFLQVVAWRPGWVLLGVGVTVLHYCRLLFLIVFVVLRWWRRRSRLLKHWLISWWRRRRHF